MLNGLACPSCRERTYWGLTPWLEVVVIEVSTVQVRGLHESWSAAIALGQMFAIKKLDPHWQGVFAVANRLSQCEGNWGRCGKPCACGEDGRLSVCVFVCMVCVCVPCVCVFRVCVFHVCVSAMFVWNQIFLQVLLQFNA